MPYRSDKNARKRKLIKFGALTLLLAVIVYAGYILYWPAATLLKQILKSPSSVFSLIKNPKGELKATDGRTNFLLVGIDKRADIPYTYKGPGGEIKQNGFLTDTVLVASISKDKNNVSMVSIPRDLWVEIPAFGKYKGQASKINALYSFGDKNKYPGGGMELLRKQVEEILGIPLHYGVRIDFEGFEKAIDTLGGVDVLVEKTFDDYQYPVDGKEAAKCEDINYSCRYKHLHFDAGTTHMDGETALAFVRSRKGTNGEGSDFARAARQQKVMLAAKDKALKLENLLDPVKLSSLFDEFDKSVETDLDVSALVALYNLGREIQVDKVSSLVLDNSTDNYLYTPSANQYGGAYVLLPKGNSWEIIQKAVDNLLNPPQDETDKKDT
ncbi:MAG TPA: LCP family protein [Candidatus Nanoarchaeia archaeon]